MSLQDLANMGEAVGGLAVLVTLVYLALQLRQNTRAVRAATYQQVVDATSDWSAMMAKDDSLISLFSKATEEGLESLSEIEGRKFTFCLLTLLRRVESVHYQEAQGTLEREAWLGLRDSLQVMFESQGVQDWWQQNGYRFRPAFRDFVEAGFLNQHHP